MTTVQTLAAAWKSVDEQLRATESGAAKREFALSKTAIEDAIMRFNRGMSEARGLRRDFDFETNVETGT